MNYERHYNLLIDRVRFREAPKFSEIHHIVPKCLGGSNRKDNLVSLTFKEHFLAHWLLCKIYPSNSKLKLAFRNMVYAGKNNRIVSGWMFEVVKKNLKENFVPWNKGRKLPPRSEEAKRKTSESCKKFWQENSHNRIGIEPWNKGKSNVQVAWNKGKEMPKFKCIHCGKEASQMNITKWHNDNCRTANK